ncbi:MAG: hypothetical protein M0036_11400 [Desulfobacteraceae bacterium]|nr:hypothetical protein [Desulfobacteraceae bacterium]
MKFVDPDGHFEQIAYALHDKFGDYASKDWNNARNARDPISLVWFTYSALVNKSASLVLPEDRDQWVYAYYTFGAAPAIMNIGGYAGEAVEGALSKAPAIIQKVTSKAAGQVIAFAEDTGKSAFTPDRLQHASRHLIDAGVLPNWSKTTAQQFTELGSKILENPIATFDHVLKGGHAVKGFIGKMNGKDVAMMVFKEGPLQGKLATAVVPTAEQMTKWGVR